MPAKVYPYRSNTPWRVELGERLVASVTSIITEAECEGYTLFGDQTWCMKAMRHENGGGLSFGIEERDLWSESVSRWYHVPTQLFDCFIPPENSPPIAGTAPNGTGCDGNVDSSSICYATPYQSFRVCLGAQAGVLEGRMYTTLADALAGRAPLSTHVKIDVEGSEWSILEQLLSSPSDLAKVRTLDMEVHFGFNAMSERPIQSSDEYTRLLREVRIMEELGRRMQVTGSTLEVYRQGWWPDQDCPMHNCGEPPVHTAGGFSVQQFAVSYVNRAYLPGRPPPSLPLHLQLQCWAEFLLQRSQPCRPMG